MMKQSLDREHRYTSKTLAGARLQCFQNKRTNIQKSWHVIRVLPAGMDIAPDAWHFYTLEAAYDKFDELDRQLQGQGFAIV